MNSKLFLLFYTGQQSWRHSIEGHLGCHFSAANGMHHKSFCEEQLRIRIATKLAATLLLWP